MSLRCRARTCTTRYAGSGPVLLLIPGGVMDAAMFARVVVPLADRYTVVTYDPHGISSSTLNGPAADLPVDLQADLQADDAHRLLSALTTEPAYVFGNSSGATTGLALVTRHSEQVRVLVAHEPPLVELLPDCAQLRTVPARRAGMALEAVQAQAGHVSIESTRIYLHLADDSLAGQYRRAAEAIDAQLLVGRPSPDPAGLSIMDGARS
jgi:pimeloyl-ACP methyl ester carboxylesterase